MRCDAIGCPPGAACSTAPREATHPASIHLAPQGQQAIGTQAGVAHDGAVDWGHMKADVVQARPAACSAVRMQRVRQCGWLHAGSVEEQRWLSLSHPAIHPAPLPTPTVQCSTAAQQGSTTFWRTLEMRAARLAPLAAARHSGRHPAWAVEQMRRPCRPGACVAASCCLLLLPVPWEAGYSAATVLYQSVQACKYTSSEQWVGSDT